jgi:hypothetical protein
MERFVAEIALATPLIAPRLIGDSLLAGIAYQRHHDWERSIRELPIAHFHGVPQMSAMLPYALATKAVQRVTIYRSIMRDFSHDPDIGYMLDKQPPKSSLNAASGPLSNIGNHYDAYDVPRIYFLGVGDLDAVERTLKSASFIGSQKAKGYGEVTYVNVWEVTHSWAQENQWFGMVGWRNGRNVALRPIPRRLAELFPQKIDHILSTETWHNPYHPGYPTSVVEPCMTPPFERGESFSVQDIENDLSRVEPSKVAMAR